MAKLSIILDIRKQTGEGNYPIKLKLYNNETSTTISTGRFIPKDVYVGDVNRVVSERYKLHEIINGHVRQLYLEYARILLDIEREGKLVYATAARIKEEIDSRIKQKAEIVKDITLTDEMEKYAADCNKEKTAQGYRYAYKLLAEFMGKNVIYFEDVTYSTLDSLDKYLSRQKKMSINSRSIIFRNIRAVFNHSIKYDLISADLYPFKRFEIKKGVAEKEVLSLDELRELINLDLTGNLAKARDFFVLSFLLCGVNPIDLYQMENANKKGVVTFVREKIEHTEPEPIYLHIEKQAIDIINRYKGEEFLLNFKEKYDYDTFTRRMHRHLKIVGCMIGRNLYMYIARHTWATIADELGIPHEIISKALGHTDKSTAERYYIRFDWTKVHRANKQVIDYVYSTSSTC